MAGTAVSVASEGSSFGSFAASASSTESTDRSLNRDFYANGGYHKIIWVRYKWVEDQSSACNHISGCTLTDKWSLNHWQGSIGQYNPDLNCARRDRHHRCVKRVTA
jgi:hypothetical protein